MKNKQIYCKYIIQFNSIPKIISLIALLFLVSCSSIEEPETKYLELAGTWVGRGFYRYGNVIINIDKDGNFSFNSLDNGDKGYRYYNYTGKLADNFEYPYTIELVYNIYSSVLLGGMTQAEYDKTFKTVNPQQKIGKFTFIDATTCEASFYIIDYWNGNTWDKYIYNDDTTIIGWRHPSFKKQ